MEVNRNGNEKLGSCVVSSRAVGNTCPSTCEYLGNGCYAEFTEQRFPASRQVGLRNIVTEKNKIRSFILWAIKNRDGRVRLHERGDFLKDGKIDRQYIANLRWAILSIIKDGHDADSIWVYTHKYAKSIAALSKLGIHVYASVHNENDLSKAKAAGFTLFAYCDTDHRFMGKKKKGGSSDAPSRIEFGGEQFLVCPEQRLGRKKVTCCGNAQSKACLWCVKGRGNVAFIDH